MTDMATIADWLLGIIVGKALAEQHRRWLFRKIRQTASGNSHGVKPPLASTANEDYGATSSSASNRLPTPSAAFFSSEPLTEVSVPTTFETLERISQSSSQLSIFSSTESMISKPTIYMTMPERHHGSVVSHQSIASISIGVDSLEALATMQCCVNALLERKSNIPAIGFQSFKKPRQVHSPALSSTNPKGTSATNRKLAKEMEAEMRKRAQKQLYEAYATEARQLQKMRAIKDRKAKRKQQFPPPPFVAPAASTYSAEDFEVANKSDLIFFPSIPDEGEICPTWDLEELTKAGHCGPRRDSSKLTEPTKPVPSRIKQVKNMGKTTGDSVKQGHMRIPSKLTRPRRPTLPASKRNLELMGLETIQEGREAVKEHVGSGGKGKARYVEA